MRTQLVTIWWRDIPAQVNAQTGRARHRVALDGRFERAIDRAAMVAGLTNAQDYTAQWRRESSACGDQPEAEAEALARRLEAEFDDARLSALVANGGFAADGE